MKRIFVTTIALAMIAAAGAASADRHGHYRGGYAGNYQSGYNSGYGYDGGPRYDTATVVNVDPILAPGRPQYRRECWREPSRYVQSSYNDGYRNDGYYNERRGGAGTTTGTVLGGILGAALGNQIGDGNGRRAATIAGAALGAAIANDSIRRNNSGGYSQQRYYGGNNYNSGYAEVERCREVQVGHRDDQVIGYNVTYDYNGQLYNTRTDYHPGNNIRVRVDITPEG